MSVVSVVVLTMGDRPEPLAAAIASARAQTAVDVEIVLVVNGGEPDRSLADIVVDPGENLGIPGGRNAGATAASGDLLCFLDDDGELLGDDVFSLATEMMNDRLDLAAIALRIVDEIGETARRHHPGLRGDPTVSSDVSSFPGGACILRRRAFDAVGAWCAPFFYGLEETDLAWRLIDEGWSIWFAADLRMRHPSTDPSRHPEFHARTARNRVWLAHRRLPLPVAVLYVMNWIIISCGRSWRQPDSLRSILSGTMDGIRCPIGARAPMRWRSVLRLTRLGRPPVI